MRRLYVLRPEPAASATAERAKASGLDALAMPLFKVEPVDWEAPDPAAFDALLVTSANAVRHAGPRLEALAGLPVYAVGEATAAAAAEAGFEVAASGEGGVQQLLDSIPPGVRLLHLRGEHHVAPDSTRAVAAVTVYRSAELPMPVEFGSIDGQVAAVHSQRSARRLAELADRAEVDRGSVRIAAISPAAAAGAGAGWERCEAADVPGEAALLALAARLCDNRSET